MQRTARVVGIIAALLVLAVLGAAMWWHLGDKGALRAAAIERAAGRQLTLQISSMEGGFIWHNIIPQPALTLHDVQLGRDGATIAQVPQARAGLSWLGILRGKVPLDTLDLDGATVAQPLALLSLLDQQARLRHLAARQMVVVAASAGTAPQTLSFNSLTLDAGRDGNAMLHLDGDWNGTALAVDAQAADFHALRTGLRQKLTGNGTLGGHDIAFTADYSRRPLNDTVWNLLDTLTLQIDGQALNGTAAIAFDNKAQVIVKLTALSWQVKMPAVEQADAPLFSRTPLPWGTLAGINGAGSVMVSQLMAGDRQLGPALVQAHLQDGLLDADVILQPPGSAQPLHADLQARAATQQVSLTVKAPALAIPYALPVRAPLSLNMALAGQGTSAHDLAQSAHGAASLVAGAGQLDATALPDVVKHALDFTFGPDQVAQAALSCLKAEVTLNGPQTVLPNMNVGLTGNLLKMAGSGSLDLGGEQLGLTLVAAPQVQPLAGLTLPVTLAGSLRQPQLGADTVAAFNQLGGQLAGKLASQLVGVRLGKTIGDKAGQLANSAASAALPGTHENIPMPPNPCEPAAQPVGDIVEDTVTAVQSALELISPQTRTEIDAARTQLLGHLQSLLSPLTGAMGGVLPQ